MDQEILMRVFKMFEVYRFWVGLALPVLQVVQHNRRAPQGETIGAENPTPTLHFSGGLSWALDE